MAHATLEEILKKNGYSRTTARSQVFNLLKGQEPQTMQVLVSRAKGSVDRASVYRAVSLFEQLGIVHRINVGWKYKVELTDLFTSHRHHFHCVNCGITQVLPSDQPLEKKISQLSNSIGARAHQHQLEIQGLCLNCLAAK